MSISRTAAIIISLCSAMVMGGCGARSNTDAPESVRAAEPADPAPSHVQAVPIGALQKITGLGVNANVHSWNSGELRPAIDQISDLGEVTWRVIIDKADWELQRNTADPSVIDWNYYGPIYSRGKMADLWETIGYINTKPGQQVMINVMGDVPGWMGGSKIDEAFEDQWVRMIASMIGYGRIVKKLDFKLVSPMNEIDHDGIEGPQVQPAQYVRLLHKLVESLDRLGLSDIGLVGPDTASPVKGTSAYLKAMSSDSLVMSRTSHLALHSYDGDTGGAREALGANPNPDTDFWITEFSGSCPGCDSGSPNPSDWGAAQGTASLAIELLEAGASGLQYYDAWDGYYEHHSSIGYWGLLAYDSRKGSYLPRKTYYVMKQLIRFIPRGALRIPVESSDQAVSAVAFLDVPTGRVTIFAQNTAPTNTPITLSLSLVKDSLQLAEFVTDPNRDMTAGSGAALDSGHITYDAGASSVFTLTGTPGKG